MKLNHIDLQVPDVIEAVAFFERWFEFTLTTSRNSPALAVLHVPVRRIMGPAEEVFRRVMGPPFRSMKGPPAKEA